MTFSNACGAKLPTGGKIIKDLASIELITDVYYDTEHGKEPVGLYITIMYYNSEKQVIAFNKIPVNVEIEIYGYTSEVDLLGHQNPLLVYDNVLTIDHSPGVTELTQNKYIRIPFTDLGSTAEPYIQWGTVNASVFTTRATLEASKDMVPLYPDEY